MRNVKEFNLSHNILFGLKWNFISAGLSFIIHFSTGVVLARILEPRDFGLFALAIIVVTFAETVSGFGVESAIIQKPSLTDSYIKSSFSIAILTGIVGSLIIFSVAPLALYVFKDYQVVHILRVISITFLLSSIGMTSRAILRREFDFKRIMYATVSSYLVGYSLVAIPLALLGFGVWSLVWGHLIYFFMLAIMQYTMTRHPIGLRFKKDEMKKIVSFGGGVSLANIFQVIAHQGDYFMIGSLMNSYALGIYKRGYNLMIIPVNYFGKIASKVLSTSYARLQDERKNLSAVYLATVDLVTSVTLPIMIVIFIHADSLIVGIYGEKWVPTVPVLKILAIFGIFRNVQYLAGGLAVMTGNVYPVVKIGSLYALLILIFSSIGTKWGINGVAYGVGLAIIINYILMAFLSVRIINGSLKSYFSAHINSLRIGAFFLIMNYLLKYFLMNITSSPAIDVLLIIFCNGVSMIIIILLLPSIFLKNFDPKILKQLEINFLKFKWSSKWVKYHSKSLFKAS